MQAGRELDKLVAENVMGWRECKVGIEQDIKGLVGFGLDRQGQFRRSFPEYSTNIADAWLVVEEMAKRSNALALQAPGSTDMNEAYRDFTRWTADFDTNNIRVHTEAEGDTAPHAICLAALRIVRYSFPEEG